MRTMRCNVVAICTLVLMALLVDPSMAQIPVGVKISPGSSTLVTTQVFDIVFIIGTGGAQVKSAKVLFDGADVTAVIIGLQPRIGATADGQFTARLPGIRASALGLGPHTFRIEIAIGDFFLTDQVTYTVVANTEP